MKNKKNPLSGIIKVGESKSINFYLDGYTVTFLDTENLEIRLEEQFIYGRTHNDFKNIAIYKGDNALIIHGTKKLNTGLYIIAQDNALCTNWETFDSILLKGGILNSLFTCRAIKRIARDDNGIYYQKNDDSLHWLFTVDGCECELIVGSQVTEKDGLDGTSLSNNTACMRLKFNEHQQLKSAIRYILKVKEALGFMTFRKNVGFDEIYLLHNDRGLSRMQMFFKEERPVISKSPRKCITFHDLDTSVTELFSLVFNSEDGKPSYEFGFFPNSDEDAGIISNDKIRLICSSVECELSFIHDLYPEEERNLTKLIDNTKKTIKIHRKTDERLSDKTYDLIFSSIENWTMSASNRIRGLYQRYTDELNLISRNGMSVDEVSIDKLIKYRNKITHGTYRIIDQEIAATAYLLQGLVYCCILTRIGMNRERLQALCKDKLFLL